MSYPYKDKSLQWLLDNYHANAQDVNFQYAVGKKILEMWNQVIDIFPATAALSAPDFVNVVFMRSGKDYGDSRKDIIVRRYGDKALEVYNATDSKSLFCVDEDGKVTVGDTIGGRTTDVLLVSDNTGIDLGAIGTSYTPVLDRHNPDINLAMMVIRAVRIIASVKGDENGEKGIKVFAGTNELGEIAWSGTNEEKNAKSSWKGINLDAEADVSLNIKAKASSETESVTVYSVRVQFVGYVT